MTLDTTKLLFELSEDRPTDVRIDHWLDELQACVAQIPAVEKSTIGYFELTKSLCRFSRRIHARMELLQVVRLDQASRVARQLERATNSISSPGTLDDDLINAFKAATRERYAEILAVIEHYDHTF